MRSMDFEEFLWARGIPEKVISDVRGAVTACSSLNEGYIDVLREEFRHFMVVGGMPESVQRFVDTGRYNESRKVLRDIIESCRGDIIR